LVGDMGGSTLPSMFHGKEVLETSDYLCAKLTVTALPDCVRKHDERCHLYNIRKWNLQSDRLFAVVEEKFASLDPHMWGVVPTSGWRPFPCGWLSSCSLSWEAPSSSSMYAPVDRAGERGLASESSGVMGETDGRPVLMGEKAVGATGDAPGGGGGGPVGSGGGC